MARPETFPTVQAPGAIAPPASHRGQGRSPLRVAAWRQVAGQLLARRHRRTPPTQAEGQARRREASTGPDRPTRASTASSHPANCSPSFCPIRPFTPPRRAAAPLQPDRHRLALRWAHPIVSLAIAKREPPRPLTVVTSVARDTKWNPLRAGFGCRAKQPKARARFDCSGNLKSGIENQWAGLRLQGGAGPPWPGLCQRRHFSPFGSIPMSCSAHTRVYRPLANRQSKNRNNGSCF